LCFLYDEFLHQIRAVLVVAEAAGADDLHFRKRTGIPYFEMNHPVDLACFELRPDSLDAPHQSLAKLLLDGHVIEQMLVAFTGVADQ
jgi:hypothetical protein